MVVSCEFAPLIRFGKNVVMKVGNVGKNVTVGNVLVVILWVVDKTVVAGVEENLTVVDGTLRVVVVGGAVVVVGRGAVVVVMGVVVVVRGVVAGVVITRGVEACGVVLSNIVFDSGSGNLPSVR